MLLRDLTKSSAQCTGPPLSAGTNLPSALMLLRQACGRRDRPSNLRRTAWVRRRASRLRTPVSRRGLVISSRTVMNHPG